MPQPLTQFAPRLSLLVRPFVLSLLLALVAAIALSPLVAYAASSTYYFKYFLTSGSISAWYTNDNSWGVNGSQWLWLCCYGFR